MKELALHILDIAENSVAAGATTIKITIKEDLRNDRICIVVQDDGKGMDTQTLNHITDPFVTTRKTRVAGLGIPFLKATAEECNGELHITSIPEKGTRLEVELQRSHLDRMPLGDLAGTMLVLAVGYQGVNWSFRYQVNKRSFTFDTVPIKQELKAVSLTEPSVLKFIRRTLQNGIQSVQK